MVRKKGHLFLPGYIIMWAIAFNPTSDSHNATSLQSDLIMYWAYYLSDESVTFTNQWAFIHNVTFVISLTMFQNVCRLANRG